eukprot:4260057-Alexandrium_andersonii.AAC.1
MVQSLARAPVGLSQDRLQCLAFLLGLATGPSTLGTEVGAPWGELCSVGSLRNEVAGNSPSHEHPCQHAHVRPSDVGVSLSCLGGYWVGRAGGWAFVANLGGK